MLKLRPYQQDGINDIRKAFFAGKRSPLYCLPTGGGKTVVFSYIGAASAAQKKRVLILVHRKELLRQASRSLHVNGVDHGLIAPKLTPNMLSNVQVASVQTLIKRLDKYHFAPDLIIIDEAHHANAGSWRKIIEHFPKARILGVTATPIRSDGSGLGKDAGGMFDELIEGPQIDKLIEQGYLVRPIVYAPAERLDLTGIHTRMGDYAIDEVNRAVDKPAITGSAVEHYRRLCPGTPAVAFCASVIHAEHVAQEFRNAGFRAYSVDGETDPDTRDRILSGLGNGSVQIVTSCDIISEGTDIPAIGCAILLRPTQSTGLYLQQVGRALRTAKGKDKAIILDHVGNVLTHGMPDELREWTLDGMERKKKNSTGPNILVRQCDMCFAVHRPAPACPHCGHEYIIEGNEPEQKEGELRAITDEDRAQMKLARNIEVSRAKSLEELREIAQARGYKPGWAVRQWSFREARNNRTVTGIRE